MRLGCSLLLAFAALMLTSCEPDDVPRYSPDGKSIVLLTLSGKVKKTKEGEIKLKDAAVFSLESKRLNKLTLPEGWSALGVRWMGNKILVRGFYVDLVDLASVQTDDQALLRKAEAMFKPYWLLDPSGKEQPKNVPISGGMLGDDLFLGRYQNKPCIYLPGLADGSTKSVTKVLSQEDFKQLAVLPYRVKDAGDGWIIRVNRIPSKTVGVDLISSIEVLDNNLKAVAAISREEIAKANSRGPKSPRCARISDDKKQLLLAFSTGSLSRQRTHKYTFGVYSVSTGKLLWKGSSNALRGFPVFRGGAVYALEAKNRNIDTGERTAAAITEDSPRSTPASAIVLARHSQEGRKVVVQLPMNGGERANKYSASQDTKSFVLQTEGDQPKLFIVPIRDKVETKEIKRFELK